MTTGDVLESSQERNAMKKMSMETMNGQATIREEELKNRIAALFFGKYDCTRIVGNIDFCVLPKRRDPRQMMFIPDAPILSFS